MMYEPCQIATQLIQGKVTITAHNNAPIRPDVPGGFRLPLLATLRAMGGITLALGGALVFLGEEVVEVVFVCDV